MTKKPSSLAKPPFAATRAHGPGSPGLVLIGAVAAAFAVGFGMAMQLVPMCGNRSDADRGLISTMCTVLASGSPPSQSALRRGGHTPLPPPSPPLMDPWAHTTHPGMATEGWNWTQLSMSRAGNFPPTGVKQYTMEQVSTKGSMWAWHTTFARSIPVSAHGPPCVCGRAALGRAAAPRAAGTAPHHLWGAPSAQALVEGMATPWSERISRWKIDDFRREWGRQQATPRGLRGLTNALAGRLSGVNLGRRPATEAQGPSPSNIS